MPQKISSVSLDADRYIALPGDHQGTMQRTIHQIKLMPVSTFYSLQWEGRNMLAEILNLAPGVCVLLALGALLYVTRT